jgi:hypothetical protein
MAALQAIVEQGGAQLPWERPETASALDAGGRWAAVAGTELMPPPGLGASHPSVYARGSLGAQPATGLHSTARTAVPWVPGAAEGPGPGSSTGLDTRAQGRADGELPQWLVERTISAGRAPSEGARLMRAGSAAAPAGLGPPFGLQPAAGPGVSRPLNANAACHQAAAARNSRPGRPATVARLLLQLVGSLGDGPQPARPASWLAGSRPASAAAAGRQSPLSIGLGRRLFLAIGQQLPPRKLGKPGLEMAAGKGAFSSRGCTPAASTRHWALSLRCNAMGNDAQRGDAARGSRAAVRMPSATRALPQPLPAYCLYFPHCHILKGS